jgi:hypothetical protein
MNKEEDGIILCGVSLLLVVVAILLLVAPFGVIWAINTLFGMGIPYGVQSYAAALILILVMPSGGRVSKG